MISLIFPTFNESENLEELHKRVSSVVDKISDHSFEFLFIDDSSNDQTPEILKRLHTEDKRVKTIRFARNCGSHAAVAAGLVNCKGDCAIALAADLQDPPNLIPKLLEKWNNPAKLIWGVRAKRKGETALRKFCANRYYSLMNFLTCVKTPPTGADVFLVDRAIIEAYKQMTEKHTSVFMALAWLGFSQDSVEYVKEVRYRGLSKWTLGRKIKLTIDSLLSFSDVTIRYMSVLGFITAFCGLIYAATILWNYINGAPVTGWSSLIITILVIGGIQMIMLGILGEYLWRTFDESRKRPRFIIEYKID